MLALFALALLLSGAAIALAQGDGGTSAYQQSPTRQAMELARDLIEDDLGYRMRLRRWRYYEDNWSSIASVNMYGSFGIDNCNYAILPQNKRGTVIFGWTFIFTEKSSAEHQARVSFDLSHSVICDEVKVPPQYAAPEPTAVPQAAAGDAPAAAAVAGPAAVSAANLSGFQLGGHIHGLTGEAINAMRNSGMTWVKKQVTHGVSDGRDVIGWANSNGFRVLLGALGDKNKLAANFDGYIAEFAAYVGFLASNGAHAIEVWNEPNIQREWPAGQINGANYTRLLAAAYNAIKAANNSTIVISGAPAPTGYSQTGCQHELCNDNTFLAQMAAAGAAKYMDCVGAHYNAGIVPPTATSGAPVGSSGHYSWYLPSMMSVYRGAFPSKPVCFTELGYLSGEGYGQLPTNFAWAGGTSLAEHAAWLGGAVNVARGSGYVNMIIVWNVNFKRYDTDPMAGYAIIRPGGGCPACNSLRAAMGG